MHIDWDQLQWSPAVSLNQGATIGHCLRMKKSLKILLEVNRSRVRMVVAAVQQLKDRSDYVVLVVERGSAEWLRLEGDMGGGREEGLFGEVVIAAVKLKSARRILGHTAQSVKRWLAKADDRLPLIVAT